MRYISPHPLLCYLISVAAVPAADILAAGVGVLLLHDSGEWTLLLAGNCCALFGVF